MQSWHEYYFANNGKPCQIGGVGERGDSFLAKSLFLTDKENVFSRREIDCVVNGVMNRLVQV